MGILGGRNTARTTAALRRPAQRDLIRRSNQVQSLCRILGAGSPSMQGIVLKYL
jgi:hypothetical protein